MFSRRSTSLCVSATLLLFFLTNCTQQEREPHTTPGSELHPTEENLLPAEMIDHTISSSDSVVERVDSTSLDWLTSIGRDSGEQPYMFGRIRYTGILDNQMLAIFDDQASHLRLFDLDTGEFLQQIGRPGRGPGEMVQVSGLYTTGSLLYVADRMHKIEEFNLSGREEYDNRSNRVNFSPIGVCKLGDYIFAAGLVLDDQKILHQYDAETFEHIRSFHDVYSTDFHPARMVLSQIMLTCNESSGRIIVVSSILPYVYGYHPDGELAWVSEIQPFFPRRAEVVTRQGSTPSINTGFHPDGFSDLHNRLVSSGDSETVVLQVIRFERENNEHVDGQTLTFSINSRTGEGELLSRSLPNIQAYNRDFVITSTSSPFPQLLINKNNGVLP